VDPRRDKNLKQADFGEGGEKKRVTSFGAESPRSRRDSQKRETGKLLKADTNGRPEGKEGGSVREKSDKNTTEEETGQNRKIKRKRMEKKMVRKKGTFSPGQ